MRNYSPKQNFFLFLAGTIIPALIYLFGITWRVRYINKEAENSGPPLIWAFWHSRLLPLVYFYRKRGVVVLVSRSFDGEIIARIIEKMGFRTIRGSSSRGGMESLREIVRELKKGSFVAFTPDGPRGPAEIAQGGASMASVLSGAPLVPTSVASNCCWKLKSWDKFRIPKPFARIEIRQDEPIWPEGKRTGQMKELLQTHLEKTTHLSDESVMRK